MPEIFETWYFFGSKSLLWVYFIFNLANRNDFWENITFSSCLTEFFYIPMILSGRGLATINSF